MRIVTATEPGDTSKAGEDWILAERDLVVVLDGATARTDTGCRHGIAWYAAKLGAAIASHAVESSTSLKAVLAHAIANTADQHRECDLAHVATPSAAVAIVRTHGDLLEYLVLGDVTVVIEANDQLVVLCDDRVDATAVQERTEAARHPFGTAEKQAALLLMKHAELAVRNKNGGFWIAASDPTVADQAIVGALQLKDIRRFSVLTDGAARAVVLFGLLDWRGVLDLLDKEGPAQLISRVRAAEAADPSGHRWPRNKGSDDASAVFVGLATA